VKPSAKTDIICVEKILKYIDDIKDCLEHFNIKSHNDLKSTRLSQLAITQVITNICEVKKKITPETLQNLQKFDRIKVVGARNIASHDYERINFKIIYDICNMLSCDKVIAELKEVVNNANRDKP